MKVLDFWPYAHGLKIPSLQDSLGSHELVHSRAGGIDPLLNAIKQHKPDVLIGDFGPKGRGQISMSDNEFFFRELREKHPDLPIVICAISSMTHSWEEISGELNVYVLRVDRFDFSKLPAAIEQARKLVSI